MIARTLDALSMLRAAGRELGRIAISRGGGLRDDPLSASAITPELMDEALSAACPGVHVGQLRTLDGHSGTTDRARIAIRCEQPGDGETPPASVFVKTAPRSLGERVFVGVMELGSTEVRFYDEIARAVRIPVPRAWHARHDPRTGRFLLVLEDLAAAGARFTDVAGAADRADLETTQKVVTTLGTLHAGFWQSPRFDRDLSWLRRAGPRPGLRRERFLCRALVGRGVERFRDAIPDRVRASTRRLLSARDALENAWAQGDRTLIHGDSHIGNMYFLDGEAGLLDWQVTQCGQGMRDVSYFLVNSVPTELRRTHERDLIELWRAAVAAGGATPPAADEAFEQHRLHAAYTWIGAAVTAAVPGLQPTAIARAGLTRATRALLDLDTLEALARIGA